MKRPLSKTATLGGFRVNSKVSGTVKNAILDWPVWWRGLSLAQKILPALAVALYWLTLNVIHGFRGDHATFGVAYLALTYGGRHARKLRSIVMPFLLTAVIYDSQRFYSDYIRGPVHVTEPYDFDKRFFGIHTPDGLLTPNEYWQKHQHAVLDFFTGLAYLVFILVFAGQSLFYFFYLSHKGTETMSPGRVHEKSIRMIWSFFWVNMIGYTTYYWFAASPPWYVAKYGLGPARLDVPASSAGCVRFDELLGTHFFSEMYGRAADVHGAIPSLHVSYPFIAVLFAMQFKRMRVFSVLFYSLMCFSAVYLNHHYVLDILWGSTYAILTVMTIDRVREKQGKHETAF
jgi:membrane-associated phospholipid phosphatase